MDERQALRAREREVERAEAGGRFLAERTIWTARSHETLCPAWPFTAALYFPQQPWQPDQVDAHL